MEIIELTNEDGEIEKFELLDTFGMNDQDYAVFSPIEDEDGPIYILRIDFTEEGEVHFSGVDDDELKDLIEVYEELLDEIED